MKKTIGYLMTAAVTAAVITLAGCGSDDDKTLPKIDGYNNSDEVASANLVAHWSFDADNKEVKSGTAPSNTYGTVGSTTGQIGNALKLTQGVLVYPPIAAINTADALNNFTLSMWINDAGNKGVTNKFSVYFGIYPTAVDDVWPNVGMMAETSRHLPSSDTMEWKTYFNTTTETGQNGQDNVIQVNGDGVGKWSLGAKKWTHVVSRWNGTTHQFDFFANAVNSGAYTDRGTAPKLVMRVPAQVVFGSFANQGIGFASAPAALPDWSGLTNASIDDVRIYNSLLSDVEISALFNLGSAGR